MKECVIKVQTQHHLDVIIGRVRSLGGKYRHCNGISVNSKSIYTTYQAWIDMGLSVYMWITVSSTGLNAYLHSHDCSCEVLVSVQDAVEYLGLGGE